jgi:hypothetical protein
MSRLAGTAARRRGPSGRPLEPPGDRRPQMDDRRRALGLGTEPGVQAASLAPPRPALAGCGGQVSSARKICDAVQALQIGIAVSRHPSGSGSVLSG